MSKSIRRNGARMRAVAACNAPSGMTTRKTTAKATATARTKARRRDQRKWWARTRRGRSWWSALHAAAARARHGAPGGRHCMQQPRVRAVAAPGGRGVAVVKAEENSRFPAGMTTRKATTKATRKATAKATAKATRKTTAKATATARRRARQEQRQQRRQRQRRRQTKKQFAQLVWACDGVVGWNSAGGR